MHTWSLQFRYALSFIILPLFLYAQPPDFEQRISRFEDYISTELANQNIIGLSVALEYKNFRWSQGYGFADLENKVPATPRSSYRMASITKPMTAIGILILVEEGKIDLDAEVQEYVPYFPRKKWPVTIRHLLGHLAGISHYKNYDLECNTTEQMTTRQALSLFADWDLLHEPGTKYQYTTYGFNLLGAAIEGASGENYEDFMRRRVWQPLSMENTQLDHLFKLIPNRVEGYRREKENIVNVRPVSTSLKFAGGGTRSTVIDLLNFAQGISAGELLTHDIIDSMWMTMVTSDSTATGYGMGWSVLDFNGRFAVGHGGGQEGTRTFILHIPEHDITVAVASNFEETNPYSIAALLTGVLLDEPHERRLLYTGDWLDNMRQQILNFCFKDGFAYYDRYKKALSVNSIPLQSAFDYLNKMADNNFPGLVPDSVQKTIERGRHPATGWAYRTVGSFMIDKIIHEFGYERIEKLHKKGALEFFKSYNEAVTKNPVANPKIKLDRDLLSSIKEWRAIEQKTWTSSVQNLRFSTDTDPAEISAYLKLAFEGNKIYPDLTQDFTRIVQDALRVKMNHRARKFAQIAYNLYPRSEQAIYQIGLIEIVDNQLEEGKNYLVRALKINPEGSASQRNLNSMAYRLASWDQVDAGLNVLKVAIELNPRIANLYDSMGELYLMKSDTTQSMAYYEHALKIDPNFENAQKMLQKIKGEKK